MNREVKRLFQICGNAVGDAGYHQGRAQQQKREIRPHPINIIAQRQPHGHARTNTQEDFDTQAGDESGIQGGRGSHHDLTEGNRGAKEYDHEDIQRHGDAECGLREGTQCPGFVDNGDSAGRRPRYGKDPEEHAHRQHLETRKGGGERKQ